MRVDTVRIYLARDGWRWRRIAPNGRIISDSGEAYARKATAERAAERANDGRPTVIVVDQE
jgi:uncharacterized protein YegP (UPF0339 family)